VVLVGWSGGGSLSLFYQAEAETPSITATPAGDPVDLTRAGFEPADGVILIAAHLSGAETLTEWLDPSVTDELDPDRREPEFDIYESACPHHPPYSAEFVARFRVAQVERNPQDHGVVPGVARDPAPARGRALLCRSSDDVRCALARYRYRPEREPIRLVLPR
jgi:hypothetical protein